MSLVDLSVASFTFHVDPQWKIAERTVWGANQYTCRQLPDDIEKPGVR
jgi:hypothetical protein